MYLKHLSLQNFRSYSKSTFAFSEGVTVILGPNTAGKTNLLEAIHLLSTGKSFKSQQDEDLIRFDQSLARVEGNLDDETNIAVVVGKGEAFGKQNLVKKYLVNNVPKRRVDFASFLPVVFFSPVDLALVTDSPGNRRRFLDHVLEQADREYRLSLVVYEKALRQRNALLQKTRETGVRNKKLFEYWDELVILHGQRITEKREDFISMLNNTKKQVFEFSITYDKSVISKERLEQYKDAEVGAGVTLVGPHRDDLFVYMDTDKEVKSFGSRGQQRLAVLQLKLLEMQYIEEVLDKKPLLLLDDIFSELDSGHIELVSEMIGSNQTILTTTHKEFAGNKFLKGVDMIELKISV